MKAPDKRHNTLLKNEADAVIAEANAVVFSSSIETFEIGDVLKSSSHLNLFVTFLIRRSSAASLIFARSASNDSRKAVFTRHD